MRLVYVTECDGGGFAYFAEGDVRGDDWNDSPYWSNAGPPYEYRVKVAWDGDLMTGDPWLCVDDMNDGVHPWLWDPYTSTPPEEQAMVWGGDSLDEFVEAINATGGTVYH